MVNGTFIQGFIYIFLLAFAANSVVIRGRPVLHSHHPSYNHKLLFLHKEQFIQKWNPIIISSLPADGN